MATFGEEIQLTFIHTSGCSKNIYFFMWRDVGHTYVQYYFYVQITFVGKNIKFVATKNTLTYSNIIMSCNTKVLNSFAYNYQY